MLIEISQISVIDASREVTFYKDYMMRFLLDNKSWNKMDTFTNVIATN